MSIHPQSAKRSSKWRFSTVCLTAFAISLLITPVSPLFAANNPPHPAEPFTDLYVVYSHPKEKTFSVELREQTRLPDGSVTARIYVRAESLIAYNLTFDDYQPIRDNQDLSLKTGWETETFLPLYPSHVYEIGLVTIEPGGYFSIQGTKGGPEDGSQLTKMRLIQFCILVMHLVGATPPVDTYEFARAVPEAFDDVFGPIGGFASFFSGMFELLGREKDPIKALYDFGQALAEFPGGADLIAKGVNLIAKTGGAITGSIVKKAFDVLTGAAIARNVKRTIDASKQLFDLPDPVMATITLAPIVLQQPERYRVFEINENYQVVAVFQNAGSELWLPEQGYELLVMADRFPFARIPLTRYVARGGEARWELDQRAPPIPGIYPIRYQMALNGVPIGMPVPAEIVVVPEDSDNLQSLIEALVAEALSTGIR